MKRLLTKIQVERYLKKAAFYGGPSYMSLNNKSVYDNIAIGMEYEQLENELREYFRSSKEKNIPSTSREREKIINSRDKHFNKLMTFEEKMILNYYENAISQRVAVLHIKEHWPFLIRRFKELPGYEDRLFRNLMKCTTMLEFKIEANKLFSLYIKSKKKVKNIGWRLT